jgi:hypothetical protein
MTAQILPWMSELMCSARHPPTVRRRHRGRRRRCNALPLFGRARGFISWVLVSATPSHALLRFVITDPTFADSPGPQPRLASRPLALLLYALRSLVTGGKNA